MAIAGTTTIGAMIAPNNEKSSMAVQSEQWNKGGYRSVATAADRDKLLTTKRWAPGMLVNVLDEGTPNDGGIVYKLILKAGATPGSTSANDYHFVKFSTGAEIDLSGYYTKEEIDAKGFLTAHQDISSKADASNVYTKQEIDSKGFLTEHQDLSGKADKETTYTKEEVDSKVGLKADQSALESANSAIATKAAQTDVDTLKDKVSGLETTVAAKAETTKVSELEGRVHTLEQAAVNSNPEGSVSESAVTLLNGRVDTLTSTVDAKADKTALDALTQRVETNASTLAGKASSESLTTLQSTVESINNRVTENTNAIATKANSADVYSKSDIDSKGFLTEHQDISSKADVANVYSRSEADEKFALKAEVGGSASGVSAEEFTALSDRFNLVEGSSKTIVAGLKRAGIDVDTRVSVKTDMLTGHGAFQVQGNGINYVGDLGGNTSAKYAPEGYTTLYMDVNLSRDSAWGIVIGINPANNKYIWLYSANNAILTCTDQEGGSNFTQLVAGSGAANAFAGPTSVKVVREGTSFKVYKKNYKADAQYRLSATIQASGALAGIGATTETIQWRYGFATGWSRTLNKQNRDQPMYDNVQLDNEVAADPSAVTIASLKAEIEQLKQLLTKNNIN